MQSRTVAVIGASNDRRKFGNKAARAYRDCNFTVYPVNPREQQVEGLKSYPGIDTVPDPVDIVSLYVPPATGLSLIDAIAAKNPGELWLNPGTESRELIEAASRHNLKTVIGCSLVRLGVDPHMISDE